MKTGGPDAGAWRDLRNLAGEFNSPRVHFYLHSYQKSATMPLFVGLAMPYGKPDKESLVLSDFLFFIKKGPLRGPFHHFQKKIICSTYEPGAKPSHQSQPKPKLPNSKPDLDLHPSQEFCP